MQKNENKKAKNGSFEGDPSEMRKAPGYENAVPGVNSPHIAPPAFNPPVPNRAWTEMRKKYEIEELSEAERKELYGGSDAIL